jgi:hypothetical protein
MALAEKHQWPADTPQKPGFLCADRVQCGRVALSGVALHQGPMPCWQAFVDHKVVVYWVAAIAPARGPALLRYPDWPHPPSPGHFPTGVQWNGEWTRPCLTAAQ